jgi:hypothetical protein
MDAFLRLDSESAMLATVMRRSLSLGLLATFAAMALSSCTTPQSSVSDRPSPSATPETFTLATEPWRGGCAGISVVATLHGDPADPRVVWLDVLNLSGDGRPRRFEVLWYPSGFTARFSPELEVFGPDGMLVAHEGDDVWGACGVEAEGVGRNVLGIDSRSIQRPGDRSSD